MCHCFGIARTMIQMRLFSVSARTHRSLYDVLQVPPSSSKREIKSKFYELSMLHHPDRNPNNEAAHAKFLELSEAYSVLGNELKRREYDREQSYASESTTGTNRGSRGSHSRSSTRWKKATINPDDYIQHRSKTSAYGTNRPPIFDFEAHRHQHYGTTAEERKQERMHKAQHFRNIYNLNRAEPSFVTVFFIGFCAFAIYSWSNLLWTEPSDEPDTIQLLLALYKHRGRPIKIVHELQASDMHSDERIQASVSGQHA